MTQVVRYVLTNLRVFGLWLKEPPSQLLTYIALMAELEVINAFIENFPHHSPLLQLFSQPHRHFSHVPFCLCSFSAAPRRD
jgi:hypothetical protein